VQAHGDAGDELHAALRSQIRDCAWREVESGAEMIAVTGEHHHRRVRERRFFEDSRELLKHRV
jgi:hypothetical protein